MVRIESTDDLQAFRAYLCSASVVLLETCRDQYTATTWAPGTYVADDVLPDDPEIHLEQHRVYGTSSNWVDNSYRDLHGEDILEARFTGNTPDTTYAAYIRDHDTDIDYTPPGQHVRSDVNRVFYYGSDDGSTVPGSDSDTADHRFNPSEALKNLASRIL